MATGGVRRQQATHSGQASATQTTRNLLESLKVGDVFLQLQQHCGHSSVGRPHDLVHWHMTVME